MNEVTLPPAPNWYMTSVLSCSKDNTVAWGSKNMIVISHSPKVKGEAFKYSVITDAHTDRVTSVRFSPDTGTGRTLLLSGGDESIIRIWDVESLSAIKSQSYLDSNQKVVGVDWSQKDPTHVCSVGLDGTVLSWNIDFNSCQIITLGKLKATCIKFSPHKSNTVAIGAKAGLVYVVNLQGSGTITYKLRGHDAEITSLSWCPTSVNVFNENNSDDFLLASGAKDASVFIWRAGSDGRSETQITLPAVPKDSNQHHSKVGSGYFTTLCWLEPKCLLASSPFGELLAMDLGSTKKSWRVIHGHHSRGLFSIACVPSSEDNQQENWRKGSRIVWTNAQDRKVICSSIENNQCVIEHTVPTHSGFIYSIAACPLETSLIAYGSGDMTIRLWNLTEPHKNSVNVTCMWQKIGGKVTALAWHPTEENLLAFGTGDGRVGVFDLKNQNKSPVLFRQYLRRTVYSLAWAPKPDSAAYGLYSCADNELVCFNYEKANEEPKSIIKKECTEFAWKPDFSCFAIGFEDGSIFFRNRELKVCGKPIFLLKKFVQCIVWHPESTLTDLEFSPMRNYMAVSTNTNKITIFDMTIMIDGSPKASENGDGEDKDTVTYKVVATLNGHSDRVISLAWNPHISGQLVSGSHDSTAQIWNVETQEMIATFLGHRGPIFACLWSPVDPDFVITGSVDFSLRVWRVSTQERVLPVKVDVKKSKSKSKSKSKKSKSTKVVIKQIETNAADAGKGSEESLVVEIDKLSVKSEIKTKVLNKKNFLPGYRKNMNNKDVALANCLKIARKLKNSDTDDDDMVSIFGTEEEIMSIIKNEQTTFTSQGQHTMTTELSLWTGDLREQLQAAAKERRLNDFMVSLSPMLSISTWKEMCEAYATQLVLESNVTKAVAYFLIVHKIYQAIDVFIEAKMYREAYTLARCRLDPKDTKLTDILKAWESHAVKSALYEDAAQCSIVLGDLVRAAQFLAKRKDIANLKAAAEIAIIAGDSNLATSLADQAVVECLLQSDYSAARHLIQLFPVVEYRLIHVIALEEINKAQKMIDDPFLHSWVEESTQYNLISVLKEKYKNLNSLEAYQKLVNISYTDFPENEANFWLSVSHNLALSATSEEHQIHHIVATFGMISQYEVLNSKKNQCTSYLLSVLASLPLNTGFEYDKPIYKSYRAYLCFALTNWLVEKINPPASLEKSDVNKFICIIELCLEDVLDPAAFKFWLLNSEISGQERLLMAAIEYKNERDEMKFRAEVNNLRMEKKKFVEERGCAPNPVVFYSNVNMLLSFVSDPEFEVTVQTFWKNTLFQ